MTGFVQVIEFRTSRIDELRALIEEMRQDQDTGTALRGALTADRDRPGYYSTIVEFDSYEAAMSNSARPEVSAFAAQMTALCDEPPRLHNLDVVDTWSTGTSATTKAALGAAAAAVAGVAATGVTKARQRLQERRGSTSKPTVVTVPGPTPVPPEPPVVPPVVPPAHDRTDSSEGVDFETRQETPPPV